MTPGNPPCGGQHPGWRTRQMRVIVTNDARRRPHSVDGALGTEADAGASDPLLCGVAPIAASIGFVALFSKVVRAPLASFWLYLTWWAVLTGAATLVLIAVDRVARRLLPLAFLFKLSLVFPDAAPSRFRTAMSSRSVTTLEERIAAVKAGHTGATPVEAAQELLALVAALDTHDSLTRGHSERVRAYAQMIAEELHLGRRDLELLNWAALLHDVGKLDVPTEILTKKGKPTDDEWAILRRHPEFGGTIVASLSSWLGDWLDAVTQHHERWDGKGYPQGTSGEQISLAGRIVSVADVFDVITSARSYKDPSDAVAGREEIARCAGYAVRPEGRSSVPRHLAGQASPRNGPAVVALARSVPRAASDDSSHWRRVRGARSCHRGARDRRRRPAVGGACPRCRQPPWSRTRDCSGGRRGRRRRATQARGRRGARSRRDGPSHRGGSRVAARRRGSARRESRTDCGRRRGAGRRSRLHRARDRRRSAEVAAADFSPSGRRDGWYVASIACAGGVASTASRASAAGSEQRPLVHKWARPGRVRGRRAADARRLGDGESAPARPRTPGRR